MAGKLKFKIPAGGDISSVSGDVARTKMMIVNDQFGIPSVKGQQGSTLWLYHTLKLTTTSTPSTLNFFAKVPSTDDPVITNVDAQNGLMAYQESIAMCFVQFHIINVLKATGTPLVPVIYGLPLNAAIAADLKAGFYCGNLLVKIDNNDVLKPNPTSVFHPDNSTLQQGAASPGTWNLFNPLVVPSLSRLQIQITLPPFTAGSSTADEYLRCTVGGPAAIQYGKKGF